MSNVSFQLFPTNGDISQSNYKPYIIADMLNSAFDDAKVSSKNSSNGYSSVPGVASQATSTQNQHDERLVRRKSLMKEIHINIETSCNLDLEESGVYHYAEDESFRINHVTYSAYCVNVIDIDLAKYMSNDILQVLKDPNVIKWAFDAQFVQVCLSQWLREHDCLESGSFINPEGWRCLRVFAAYTGLPQSIVEVCEFL